MLTFNNIDLVEHFGKLDGRDAFIVNDIYGRGAIIQETTRITVPNMDGSYLQRKHIPSRKLGVKISLRSSSLEEMRKNVESLNNIISTDDEASIVFSDESDRTYFGILDGDVDWNEIIYTGQGTINFTCSSPWKFGAEQTNTFSDNAITIQNEGNEAANPRFEIDVTSNLTHLDIVRDDGEYMRIGQPAPIDTTEFERVVNVLNDDCTSLTNWTTASEVDNGYIAGEIIATPDGFVPDKFGAAIEPYKWQGPSIIRSIPEALDNFAMTAEVDILNVGTGTGMIEVYLRDVDNNIVAKVGIEDIWRTIDKIQTKFQLGNLNNRFQEYFEAKYDYGWNDFKGVLKLFRDDSSGEKRIRPYFAIVEPDGSHNWVKSSYLYVDHEGQYQAPVTQVQIAFRVWAPTYNKADMIIKNIKFDKYVEQSNGTPYIAYKGDRIIIDHENENISINGEVRKDLKDFGASFFDLEAGYNTLHQFPAGVANTTIKHKPAYK